MKEFFRDKTRDELVEHMVGVGIAAELGERERAEEKVGKSWGTRSLGVIDVADSPIAWINVLKRDGSDKSPPQWWYVYGVPDARKLPRDGAIKLTTVRKKSFPLFGKVQDVHWRGHDHGSGLTAALSADPAVDALLTRIGDVTVRNHTAAFHGWSVSTAKRAAESADEWAALQTIAFYLTEAPL